MLGVSRSHPLRRLFTDLVRRRFFEDICLRDPQVAGYVSDMLVDFTHVDNFYRLRTARGRRLEEVAEMLIESNPLLAASSFDRERRVRKHIGDTTLFLLGMFPEHVAWRRRSPLRADYFIDYVRAGKESYFIVSAFDQFEYRDMGPLFKKLSDQFELCVFGLNLVKQDLWRFQRDYMERLRQHVVPEIH
ncbi:MAG: hypothetical protein ACE5H2_09345 [Terriglobia bacterium]